MGTPLHGRLNLLHFYHDPGLELAGVFSAQLGRNQANTAAVLRALAQRRPVPAYIIGTVSEAKVILVI